MNKKIWLFLLALCMVVFTTAVALGECSADHDDQNNWEKIEAKLPTCVAAGYGEGARCKVCKEILVKPEYISALGHSEVKFGEVKVSCAGPGYTAGTKCSVCGAILKQPVRTNEPVPAHTKAKNPIVVVAGDCKANQKGVFKYVCENYENCGYSFGYEVKLPHDFQNGYLEADHKHGDWIGEVCTKCQAMGTKGEFVSEPEHTWGPVDKKAEGYVPVSCTTDGVEIRKCTGCDAVQKVIVPKWGHRLVKDSYKWDCETDGGWTWCCTNKLNVDAEDSQTCTYEEFVVERNEDGTPVDPARGQHNYRVVKVVPMNCQQDGYTEKQCINCWDTIKVDIIPKDKNAHIWSQAEVVKSQTCETTGIARYVCTGSHEKTVEKFEVIPMHFWDEHRTETTKEPTCGEEGEKTYYCNKCPAQKTEIIPATGDHEYYKRQIKTSCDAPLYVGDVCWNCGDVYGEMIKIADVAGHEYQLATWDKEYVGPVAPCTDDEGLDVFICKDCKDRYTVPTYGDHKWEIDKTQKIEPACGMNGGYIHICTACGARKMFEAWENDQPLFPMPYDHEWVIVASQEPTCKDPGFQKVKCQNPGCNATDTWVWKLEDFDGDGHNFQLKIITKFPTCYANGVGLYRCSICRDSKLDYYSVIPSSDKELVQPNGDVYRWHQLSVVEESENKYSCMTNYTIEECSTCHASFYSETAPTEKHNFVVSYTDATCTDNRKVGYICSVCKTPKDEGALTEVPGTALGHQKKALVDKDHPYVPETCEEKGSIWYECEREGCKVEPWQEEIPAKNHDYKPTGVIIDATCTEPAGEKLACANGCGAFKVEPILDADGNIAIPSKGGHKWVDDRTVKPTCAKEGYTLQKCTNDGCVVKTQKINITPIDPNNHEWQKKSNLKDPGCTTPGIGVYKCEACEAKPTEYRVLKPEHTKGTLLEVKPGNCVQDYVEKYQCSECPEKFEVVVKKATGVHEYNDELYVSKDGTYTYNVCKYCGAEKKVDDLRCIKGHTPEVIAAIEVTCTTNGWTEGEKCSVCGTVTVEPVEIVTEGHKMVESEAVEATCETAGKTAEKKCSVCDFVELASEEIPALGHTKEAIPALDATCTEPGMTAGEWCPVCEKVFVEPTVIDALGHTEVVLEGTAATCTEAGMTGGKKCSVCDAKLGDPEEIPALGHKAVAVAGKDATCTEAGLTDGEKCEVCGETLKAQEEIPALGHKAVAVAGKDATCTEAGLTDGEKCEVCGETLKAQEKIPAKGHSFDKGVCTECGAEDPNYEAPHTHVYKKSFKFNADFTKRVVTYTCECGHTYSEEEDF